jgi:hypothetical protein
MVGHFILEQSNPKVSVFVSEVSDSGGNNVILERAAKNLMLYRHPCILKFIHCHRVTTQLQLINIIINKDI